MSTVPGILWNEIRHETTAPNFPNKMHPHDKCFTERELTKTWFYVNFSVCTLAKMPDG